MRWKFSGNDFFKLGFLKLLGRMKDTLSQNSRPFYELYRQRRLAFL
jgi:hypothetical protein